MRDRQLELARACSVVEQGDEACGNSDVIGCAALEYLGALCAVSCAARAAAPQPLCANVTASSGAPVQRRRRRRRLRCGRPSPDIVGRCQQAGSTDSFVSTRTSRSSRRAATSTELRRKPPPSSLPHTRCVRGAVGARATAALFLLRDTNGVDETWTSDTADVDLVVRR